MSKEQEGVKIVAYSRSGKPIYEPYSHPANKDLMSTELQYPMFQAYERCQQGANELKKYILGSSLYKRHKESAEDERAVYNLLGKLWRSALAREKKASIKKH